MTCYYTVDGQNTDRKRSNEMAKLNDQNSSGKNSGIINPLLYGLTYNTHGYFAHCLEKYYPALRILYVNIQSSFTVQNPRVQLVKIEHVILLYLTSANSDSALLTITHKNRALLTMASANSCRNSGRKKANRAKKYK